MLHVVYEVVSTMPIGAIQMLIIQWLLLAWVSALIPLNAYACTGQGLQSQLLLKIR